MVERLLDDPLPGFTTVRLMGNHEDAMLAFLDGDERWAGLAVLRRAGDAAVLRRAVAQPAQRGEEVSALRQALTEAVPRTPSRLLPQLHAAPQRRRLRLRARRRAAGHRAREADPDRPDVDPRRFSAQHACPCRDGWWCTAIRSSTCRRIATHRINIDTGAFVSGRLTCSRTARRRAALPLDAGRLTR